MAQAEFERLVAAGEFLEHATYSGHRYGTLRSEVEPRLERGTSVVLEIEVQGRARSGRRSPRRSRCSSPRRRPQTLRERLEGRATDGPEEIERRLAAADEELTARGEFGHVIVNDDVDRAVEELVELVHSKLAAPTSR